MACRVELHEDEAAFGEAVTPFLLEREAENALLLAQLPAPGTARAPRPFMACGTEDGQTAFAAYHSTLYLILTRGPDDAIDETIALLGPRAAAVVGVLGPAHEAERLARGLAALRGVAPPLAVEQRIYQLTQVLWPAPVPGAMRPLQADDREVAAGFAHAFDAAALSPLEWSTPEAARRRVARRIAAGELYGWQVDGALVAMAGLARPTARTISVNAVYTPPAARGRGFASALVAAISQVGLDRGKATCVLYTDLANPTSNRIYQRLGYQPVCDARLYLFEPP